MCLDEWSLFRDWTSTGQLECRFARLIFTARYNDIRFYG